MESQAAVRPERIVIDGSQTNREAKDSPTLCDTNSQA
jgi:hypothetical protein